MSTVVKSDRYRYAIIDEAPGSGGFWCEPVSMTQVNAKALFFSRRGTGVATVTLQYRTPETGSVWQDYTTSETLSNGVRFRIDDFGAGVKWRAGIKEDTSASNTYTSGTIRLGLDW